MISILYAGKALACKHDVSLIESLGLVMDGRDETS